MFKNRSEKKMKKSRNGSMIALKHVKLFINDTCVNVYEKRMNRAELIIHLHSLNAIIIIIIIIIT